MGNNKWRERTTIGESISPSNDPTHILVFLDTNFLLALSQFANFNLSYELDRVLPQNRKLIVLEPVYAELEKLHKKGRPKVQIESRLALKFVEKYCEQKISEYNHKNIDFILLHHAQKTKGIIGTNDQKLKKIANKKKVKTLFIRNKRYLELK